MSKFVRAAALGIAASVVASCASSPNKIAATSVSTIPYESYDCTQLALEQDRVNQRAGELERSLQDEADSDSAEMAVGMILFWPALFFLEGGDGPEANEYARLKGEREAIEKVLVKKSCGTLEAGTTSAGEPEAAVVPASATSSGADAVAEQTSTN